MTTRHPVKTLALILALANPILVSGCAAPQTSGYQYVKTQQIANAAYTSPYGNTSRSEDAAAAGYGGPYWSPDRFASQGQWPDTYAYGQETGANACLKTGPLYACDTSGDGLADIHGDQASGSYASAALYVNPQGQAFEWDLRCKCWQRRPGMDGPRQPDTLSAPTPPAKTGQHP